MTYSDEACLLNEDTAKILNKVNAVMLSLISGKSIRDESVTSTNTFDILYWIRARRLQWAGRRRHPARRPKPSHTPSATTHLPPQSAGRHAHGRTADLIVAEAGDW